MTPTHAKKPGKRYRYNVTRPDQLDDGPAWRVSAHDLEALICDRLSTFLTDQHGLCELAGHQEAQVIKPMLGRADVMAATMRSGTGADRAELLPSLIERIDMAEDGIMLSIDRSRLSLELGLVTPVSAMKVRRGHELRLVIPGPPTAPVTPTHRDEKLIALIAEAHEARRLILAHPERSMAAIAAAYGRCRTRLAKLAALACLAPTFVTAIVEGRQPASLTARSLQEMALPLGWDDQHALLGII